MAEFSLIDNLDYDGDIYFFDKKTFEEIKQLVGDNTNIISIIKQLAEDKYIEFKRTDEENGLGLITFAASNNVILFNDKKDYYISTTHIEGVEDYDKAIKMANVKRINYAVGSIQIPSKVMSVVCLDQNLSWENYVQNRDNKTIQSKKIDAFKSIDIDVPKGEITINSIFDKSYRENYGWEIIYPETIDFDTELPNYEDVKTEPPNIHFLKFEI